MPIVGYDKQLEGAAAVAVLAQREAVRRGFGRRERQRPGHRPRAVKRRHLGAVHLRALAADAAERDALVGEPLIGVVGPQRQPILGARGEHAIGFGDAARHQIVDHDAEIRLRRDRTRSALRRRRAPRH